MRNHHKLFQCALLGTALALTALAPASAATLSRHDLDRMRALTGKPFSAALPSRTGTTYTQSRADRIYTDLHDFAGDPSDGAGSGANVTLDRHGNIYGTTDFGGSNGDGTIFKIAPDGTESVLYSFAGVSGSEPDGALVIDHGNLYGTTGSGGSSQNGSIFELKRNGTYKVLHVFSNTEGSYPRGNLVRDEQGNFYGTALFGGTNGDGTVFEYSLDGTLTVLHTFDGTDGEFPEHGVVRDFAGNLYGVTAFGGANDEGVVYKIASDGTYSTLYNFTGGTDGGFLYGGLAIDVAGNLYGSTEDGGTIGSGTVFKLAPDGTLTTLYNFTGGADGGSPDGDMLMVGTRLYSTARSGGDPGCQCGVVYEINGNGREKVLHAFTGADGGDLSAGLTRWHKVFYGTTGSYGAYGNGVVFSLKKD